MKTFKNGLASAFIVLLSLLSSFHTAQAGGVSHVIGANVKLIATKGTTSFYQGYTWQGSTRSVLFIRPTTQTAAKAPVIAMLHYDTGTPELQANVSYAGNLAAKMGYWVILPPAVNGHWHDDPADQSTDTDDVGFLANLIQSAVKQYPLDASRVSMAGLSNGGFMTTRMACEHPELLASAVAVAAEMRASMAKVCAPSRPVPMVFVMGTKDPLVTYNGNLILQGAPTSFNTWTAYNACNAGQTSVQKLPVKVNDGTSVTLQHNAACTSLGEANLYTVNNGGHAWPGGRSSGAMFGTLSKNLDTTTMIGNFAKNWTNQSTF